MKRKRKGNGKDARIRTLKRFEARPERYRERLVIRDKLARNVEI